MKQETTLLRPGTTAAIMEAAAVAVELDDDVFFADLSKQISLLIMDDDDQELTHSSPLSLQGYSQTIHYPSAAAYQQGLPFVDNQQSCTRESKGTGVFIPRSLISQPRRKRQAKNNNNNNNTSSNSKLHKNQQDMIMSSRGILQKASYNDSYNLRKSNY